MNTTGFQLESTNVTSRMLPHATPFDDVTLVSARSRQLCRTLLRINLRVNLTEIDQIFLDGEAPPHCLAFLMRENEYLHPAGVELFPFELIESAVQQGGDAIFTHLYRDDCQRFHRPFRIITSLLNPEESPRLILGFFGPSHILTEASCLDRFATLTGNLRQSMNDLRQATSSILGEWNESGPMMLIEKETGEMIAMTDVLRNEAADSGMLPRDEIPYDSLNSLSGLLSSRQVTITDHEANGYAVCVVKLGERRNSQSRTYDVHSAITDDVLAHSASITLAASHIGGETNRQYVEIVHKETEAINRLIKRMALLVSFDNIPRREQSLYHELEHVVDRLKPTIGDKIKLVITGFIDSLNMLAPGSAVYSLYESILLNHAQSVYGYLDTNVTFDLDPANRNLVVRFETKLPISGVTAHERSAHLRQYADNLANKLGISHESAFNTTSGRLATTLTINESKRIKH